MVHFSLVRAGEIPNWVQSFKITWITHGLQTWKRWTSRRSRTATLSPIYRRSCTVDARSFSVFIPRQVFHRSEVGEFHNFGVHILKYVNVLQQEKTYLTFKKLKLDFRDFYPTRNKSWIRNSNNSTRNTCLTSRNAQPFSQEYLSLTSRNFCRTAEILYKAEHQGILIHVINIYCYCLNSRLFIKLKGTLINQLEV